MNTPLGKAFLRNEKQLLYLTESETSKNILEIKQKNGFMPDPYFSCFQSFPAILC